MLVLLVFSIRDVLFLQWCNVTNMKRPLMKGLLYLSLYYIAVSIIAAVAGVVDNTLAERVFLVATPLGVLVDESDTLRISPLVFVGLALQLGAAVLVVMAIYGRISRPAQLPKTSAAG
jgi:hypothetical protein